MYVAVACFRSTENPIGKYAGVFIGVPVFILCGFEHCVAKHVLFFHCKCMDMENIPLVVNYDGRKCRRRFVNSCYQM